MRRATQQPRQRPDLHHLSDLETSDSARPSTDQGSFRKDLRQFNPILAPTPNLATVTNQRALHQADADRVSKELLQPPSAFHHTGACPKSTPVSAPQAPTTEQITVTQAQSHGGTSATSATSSTRGSDIEQDLQDHTHDLIPVSYTHLTLPTIYPV